jgi:hypothetical protein
MMARENVLFGYIVDPDTGKIVAVIRHGEVFRNDKEGARIAIVLNANLYDLNGNLVGRLGDQNMIDVRIWSMPIAFRNLLQGANARAIEKPADGSLTVNVGCAPVVRISATKVSARAAPSSAFGQPQPVRRDAPGQ